ncbi:Cof-type HAD-IIB family hydrolase [Streptomyces kunmingensis]|uniref:Cof-type HAD-IIB family hydrolase n=1 Tax=Streptomyces kunmingensis TaxID=68225 RepID=A0ABU6CHZ2_9ACTN|nr:Cof-type HAD-IIB family hydrolase [Streptomyces kunmingensis]MEB3964334.1 Cof-type HAD-IIB family hydrolase [Streptomyces kunmingensis]
MNTHHRPDIRLVVTDMDGTLLDADGRVPDSLWPLLAELDRRGIVFCPASGRQYATLADQFAAVDDGGMVYIAENGTYVVRGGAEISSDPLDPAVASWLVKAVRQLTDEGVDAGAVVCGKRSAYVERSDEAFMAEVRKYYHRHRIVEDATAIDDEVLKVALFDFGRAEVTTAPALAPLVDSHQVVVSSEHWVDVMAPTADKGEAVRRLQRELGITAAQTMVFGDYLNDLQMLDAADWSYAMAEAHPEVRRRARHQAPSNTENGVVRTIRQVLGLPAED